MGAGAQAKGVAEVSYQVHYGDALEVTRGMEPGSVHCGITPAAIANIKGKKEVE